MSSFTCDTMFSLHCAGYHSNVERLSCTFLEPDSSDVPVVVPFSAAELKHVDGHGGSDLLLGHTHAVVEHLEKLLRLLLLVQLAVEGVLGGRQIGKRHGSKYVRCSPGGDISFAFLPKVK